MMYSWEEHGDMGEPIIYGGYGSGANAVQVPYVKPERKDGRQDAPEMQRGGGMACTVDGEPFPSVTQAARFMGVPVSNVLRALRKGNGRAVVADHEVARVY